MDTNINLKQGKTIYDKSKNYDGTLTTWCSKTVVLEIFKNKIEFFGSNQSTCAKDDTYNESFGKALAWIRASKDIGNQVENYLIKYSCKPTNSKIGDLEVNVKLNTEAFEKSLKKLANKVEDLNNQIKGKTFENERTKPDGRTYKQYALNLIDKGYTLIPLCSSNHRGMNIQHCSKCATPGKTPIVKGWGLHNYRSTKDDVEMWFRNNPDINIGALYRDKNGIARVREI